MRHKILLSGVTLILSFWLVPGLALAAEVTAQAVRVVGTLEASEDLISVPDTRWLVVSVRATGTDKSGRLELVDTDTEAMQALYPSARVRVHFDRTGYPTCPGEPPQRFDPHGMTLRPGSEGLHRLYVVHHGMRESVEVFALNVRGATPSLTWEGCVPTPPGVAGNAVAALPNGLVMSRTALPGHTLGEGAAWLMGLETGHSVGELLSWSAQEGWRKIDTAGEDLMPNGIEASPDGRWLYYADSARERFIRLSLGRTPVQKDVIETGFHSDNVHRAPDGTLLLAGQAGGLRQIMACFAAGTPSACGHARVVQIDPQTLTVENLLDDSGFHLASGAVQIGKRL